MKLIVCLTVLMSVAAAPGQDYLPLAVGNRWVYEHQRTELNSEAELVTTTDQVILEVLSAHEQGGVDYFRLSTGQLWRRDATGNLLEFDEDARSESVVLNFASPLDDFLIRAPYGIFLPVRGHQGAPLYPVGRQVTVLPVEVPAGTFNDVFEYSHGDLVLSFFMDFAPGVGLVRAGRGGDTPPSERYLLAEYHLETPRIETAVDASAWAQIKVSSEP